MLKPNDYDVPCVGFIDFNIFVHKLLNDGSIDPEILNCEKEFDELQASRAARITVTGINKLDCLRQIKEILEKLNGS